MLWSAATTYLVWPGSRCIRVYWMPRQVASCTTPDTGASWHACNGFTRSSGESASAFIIGSSFSSTMPRPRFAVRAGGKRENMDTRSGRP
ncbi:hypothetical protein BN1708_000460 [Verticillium longisporum]|uniref:Uncharacterized protein n=1 Tax=Verticillium longisporum TaxID=100787 RepID=A0A0G4LCN7_VERLO|nr:hypothetical protein BN1708_000460 [Verticillium longisporum]